MKIQWRVAESVAIGDNYGVRSVTIVCDNSNIKGDEKLYKRFYLGKLVPSVKCTNILRYKVLICDVVSNK